MIELIPIYWDEIMRVIIAIGFGDLLLDNTSLACSLIFSLFMVNDEKSILDPSSKKGYFRLSTDEMEGIT